jgi:hypothetical protein
MLVRLEVILVQDLLVSPVQQLSEQLNSVSVKVVCLDHWLLHGLEGLHRLNILLESTLIALRLLKLGLPTIILLLLLMLRWHVARVPELLGLKRLLKV